MQHATQLHIDLDDAVTVDGTLIKINSYEAASIGSWLSPKIAGPGSTAGPRSRSDDDAGRLRQLLRKALVDLNGRWPEPSRQRAITGNLDHLGGEEGEITRHERRPGGEWTPPGHGPHTTQRRV